MATETRQVSIFINGKEVENTIKAIAREKQQLQIEVNKLVRGTADYEAGVKRLNGLKGVLDEHAQKVRGVESAWQKNIPTIQSFVAASAGVFAIDRIVGFTKELGVMAVEASIRAEQVGVAFETMLGSKDKADKLQAELFELAAKTPFELPQASKYYSCM